MRKNVAGQRVAFSLFKTAARIANPTMAAGDFTVALDGAGQNNVSALPTSDAAGKVIWLPSQAETNADTVTFLANDVVGAQWEPLTIVFDTRDATAVGLYLDAAITSRALIGEAAAAITAAGLATATDVSDLETHGDGAWATATGFAVPGSAMALTTGERTTLAMVIWNTLTSALTTIGSIGKYIVDLPSTIWNYLTRTLTSSDSSLPGLGLTERVWKVVRGDTLSHTFAAIPADGSITKAQVTVKTTPEQQSDTEAILAVDTVSGLLRINGDAPGAFTASLTLLTGVFLVPAATMAQLATPKRRYWYDVQVWRGTAVQTIAYGRFELVADVTRTVAGAS